jgi:Tfp pilus assembly protein PilN
MQDDINFLPGKEKEQKEKEQARRKTKEGVKFHTPKAEAEAKKDKAGLLPTFSKAYYKVRDALKEALSFRKSKSIAKEIGKQPADLDNKQSRITAELKGKKNSGLAAEQKPKPPAGLAGGKAPVAAKPEAGSVEDFDGDYSEVDVNLMPWQDPNIRRNKYIRVVLIVGSLAVILVWGTALRIANNKKVGLITNLEQSISVIDNQLSNINQELLAEGALVAVRQNEFIDVYTAIPRWSKFFTWLESNTDQQVYYTNLDVQQEKISLNAFAPDYQTVAQQWLTFKTATSWVTSVEASGFASNQSLNEDVDEEINFSLNLEINTENLLVD